MRKNTMQITAFEGYPLKPRQAVKSTKEADPAQLHGYQPRGNAWWASCAHSIDGRTD